MAFPDNSQKSGAICIKVSPFINRNLLNHIVLALGLLTPIHLHTKFLLNESVCGCKLQTFKITSAREATKKFLDVFS